MEESILLTDSMKLLIVTKGIEMVAGVWAEVIDKPETPLIVKEVLSHCLDDLNKMFGAIASCMSGPEDV